MPDAISRQTQDARANAPSADSSQAEERNSFLRALPPDSYAQLLPHLEHRVMRVHDVLWEPNEPIASVYFPRSFVGSILIPLTTETSAVEAATVGREGLIGTAVILGVDSSTSRAIAQIEGDSAVIASSIFRERLAADSALLHRCLRYAHTLQEQTGQSVACNARHALEERCARWLLMTHDRAGRNKFVLLQVFLASMLGVHRPRVTVAAGMLQQAGLISYQRGTIEIINRAGLEAAACECYAVVRDAHERALSSSPPRGPIS